MATTPNVTAYITLDTATTPPKLVKFYPTQPTANAAATAAGGTIRAHNGSVTVGPHVQPGLFRYDNGTFRPEWLTDKPAAEQGRVLKAQVAQIAHIASVALHGSCEHFDRTRYGVTQFWLASWVGFCWASCRALEDGAVTALPAASARALVQALRTEIPDAERVSWHYWNHQPLSWDAALRTDPRRIPVTLPDGSAVPWSHDGVSPALTVSQWSRTVTTHYQDATAAGSAAASGTQGGATPGAPPNLAAEPRDQFASITWGAADGRGVPIIGYLVRWREQGSSDDWQEMRVAGTTATLPDLDNGTVYVVTVAGTQQPGRRRRIDYHSNAGSLSTWLPAPASSTSC